MTNTQTTKAADALILHEDDSVATALRALSAGSVVRVATPIGAREVSVVDDIQRCHKFALADIQSGSEIRKYGEIIGDATRDIAQGTHIHIHNISGRAGKR